MKYKVMKRENKSSGWKSKTFYLRYYDNGKLKYIDTKKTNIREARQEAQKILSKNPIKTKVTESSIKNLTLRQYLINNDWFDKTKNPLYKEYIIDKTSNHSFQERTSNYLTTHLHKIIFEHNDESRFKIMYLAINKASKKWTMPIRNWGLAINQFSIMFGDRVKF